MENKEIKVLIFKINNQYYATDIKEVERILGYEVPTNLPDSPEFIEGVINHEGNILPVMSIAKKFNIQESDNKKNAKIVVIKEVQNKIGVIVDVVSEVRNIYLKDIEQPPEIISEVSKRYIEGLIKLENKIIIFLNLGKILTDEEREAILN
ncbi:MULTISPECIES: chemotaxis protein CheW [Clostridium]|uniref:Chemotaxis protein cheW n=1 Tax=Clostridium novyi (strain NT) TaxID=386415 RepID=A0PZY1_CLONN|nr:MULTISPECIES: chemotaxis protein CheW [Clostridium]ABK61783.1 chemotaxis protein cheW [Clostridium novyi NT]KEH88367.1 chemotaxis protein CheW [Clostridium novyi A str. NCTC 538]KEH88711.1 chemotaxis protein CheW [Clostridium novyi A str. 4540]KEH89029.1 chemotaxis protein CheW [Clostridium novyi A str. BKT29909]KEH94334.1 chemotaxis protein CheW [Clostridium botulinum C/D str. It1]